MDVIMYERLGAMIAEGLIVFPRRGTGSKCVDFRAAYEREIQLQLGSQIRSIPERMAEEFAEYRRRARRARGQRERRSLVKTARRKRRGRD